MQKTKVFSLIFLAYVAPTAMRYSWAYSRPQLSEATQITMQQFGLVDFFYFNCYSLGFIALGSLIHKTTLKTYLTAGMCVACVCYMFYPIYFSITNQQTFFVLLLFMCLNGFFQAAVWPGIIGIFGNWFKNDKNGTLLALLVMGGNLGNIYASNICNILQLSGANWLYNFIVTGCGGIIVSISILVFLDQHPKNQHDLVLDLIQKQQKIQKLNLVKLQKNEKQIKNQKYGFFSLLRIPQVLRYATALACLKGCVYGLAFWLPTYFYSKGKAINNQKGFLISMYDLGSIIGAFALGYIADRFNKRAMFLSPLLFLAILMMLAVSFWLDQAWQYYIAMIFTGISIGGPYNMISTVITIDLSKILNQKSAAAKVSSLIEGVAIFFSASSMLIIPLFPFDYTLYIFSVECLVGVVILFPLSFQQAKKIPFLENYLKVKVNHEKQSPQWSEMSIKVPKEK